MEIQQPSALLPTQLSRKGLTGLLSQLHAGQRIVAVVEMKLTENNFLLRLAGNGQFLRARSQLALSPGQTLKLEVVKLGATPELRILPPQTSAAAETAAIQQALRQYLPKQQGLADLASTLQQAVEAARDKVSPLPEELRKAIRGAFDSLPQKAALIKPEGLKQALNNSGLFFEAKLAAWPESAQALTASDLKSRLLALIDTLKNLPSSAETQTQSIQQQNAAAGPAPQATPEQQASAILLDKLSPSPQTVEDGVEIVAGKDTAPQLQITETRSPPPLVTALDNQAATLRRTEPEQNANPLTSIAQPTEGASTAASLDANLNNPLDLKTLLQKTEGALAKIVLDQLASLPQSDGKQITWQIQIPFTDGRHADSAKLRIVKEGKTASQAEQAYWSVVLELNPPDLGAVHSRITLIGERIETYFWSDRETTLNLIHSHLELLAARLQQSGLAIGRLDALAGAPEESRPENLPLPAKLVDERA